MKNLPNHRIELDTYVDTEVSIVIKKNIGKANKKVILYFGVAGYKNEIMIGTDFMYEKGGMYELIYEPGLWYTLQSSSRYGFSRLIVYTEIDDMGNLIGYFDKELPYLTKDFPSDVSKELLLTPIEFKLLQNELKKDREEYLKYGGYEF